MNSPNVGGFQYLMIHSRLSEFSHAVGRRSRRGTFLRLSLVLAALCASFAGIAAVAGAEQWVVPLGGNTYLTSTATGSSDGVGKSGIKPWQNEKSVFSIYFRTDRAAVLNLILRLKVPDGESVIRAAVKGSVFEKKVTGSAVQEMPLGTISVKAAGYVRVDLQGLGKEGKVFAEVADLLVEPAVAGLKLDYVKDDAERRFYWGRRGPSIHLAYKLPAGKNVEYFYTEVMVPEGQDPIGSYFMANGFGEGYFGMQVNGRDERRILFSVWSPFQTHNPKDIPEDCRIQVLAKGETVHAGEFGNEGSGGHRLGSFGGDEVK
jgi:hypothetical protein